MPQILILMLTASRLMLFFLGRHYGRPVKFGWIGALTFGVLTGMIGGFNFAHRNSLDHANAFAWFYFLPIFVLSFLATMALDRPDNRLVCPAVAWHLIVIAYLAWLLVLLFYRSA